MKRVTLTGALVASFLAAGDTPPKTPTIPVELQTSYFADTLAVANAVITLKSAQEAQAASTKALQEACGKEFTPILQGKTLVCQPVEKR